ncbi:hypothetical protein [Nitrincola schmidtii]|uniref:hypothetical protein n=1 Tax=Nitrincola schmidtii TaxID=1730894 RepID=UPI00124C9B03|nr:hypothetical protein [Nitrincola schmidtii]
MSSSPLASQLQRPRLRPAFGVLVAGHRQQRLNQNWLQQQSERESALRSTLKQLLLDLDVSANDAFAKAKSVYANEPSQLKLITGEASGVDEVVAELAHECGYHLAAITAQDSHQANRRAADQRVILGMHSPVLNQNLSQDDYSLRDELALSFSDLLIAVWDTQEPLIITSGTARIIRTALIRRKPVLLLRLDPNLDQPQLLINRPAMLTDSHLLELEALSSDNEALLQYFTLMQTQSQLSLAISEWMDLLLLPFLPAMQPDSAENKRLAKIAAQPSLLGFLFLWIKFLFLPSVNQRPPGLFSWLAGAKQWLQVMLNPPNPSQSRRLMELLTRGYDTLSVKERLIGRLHLFCSAIARLNWTDLKTSVQMASRSKGYQKVTPSNGVTHPIDEPDLEHIFSWAETQADCFGRRHRDGIWMIYYAAAFAVFCAVAGALSIWPANMPGLLMIWAVFEFILLRFIVGHVLQARFRDWHGHWMSYRYLAEQLRYLRIGFPLLVLPQAFNRPYWSPNANARGGQLSSAENWLLQRVLISSGLPVSRSDSTRYCLTEHNSTMANYLRQVLDEHRQYFSRSHVNLHRDHVYLHRLAFSLFFITFLAVTLHFFVKISWILIFTAFFPAWGAAIHGILNHNEVVRMSSLAGQVSGQLAVLDEACTDYQRMAAKRTDTSEQQRWRQTQELRQLFATLTRILSDENQHWRSLNRHNQTDLPA